MRSVSGSRVRTGESEGSGKVKIRAAAFLRGLLAAALAAAVFAGCEDVAGNTSKAAEPGKTATPAANPAAGVVPYGTLVALSSATEGAAIYYTLDGEDPDGRSALYTGPLTITADVTIKAMAVKAGMEASGALEAAYTLDMTRVVAPTATPEAGAVAWGTRVILASVTEGAKIYYTIDGSDPDRDSTEYTGETVITISGAVTVKAIGVKEGMTDSALLTAVYALLPFEQAAAPVADPPAGDVVSGTAVTLSSGTEGAKIYYTIDGSDPDDTAEEYAGEGIPVTGDVNDRVRINAVAVKPGMDPSGILRAVYTIEEPGAVADIAVDPGTGAIPLNGQVALTTGTPGARIYYRLNADAATAVTAANGTLYTEPFTITESVSIRAVAVKEGWTASRELRIVVQPGLSCFNYDSVAQPFGSSGISALAWGGGVYVALTTGNPNAAWSADGRNWTVVSDIGAGNLQAVGYGGGKFVAVGLTKPATSPDGKTWTVIEDSGYFPRPGYTSLDANCLVYDGPEDGKLFVAGGTNIIHTSPDGEHWSAGTFKDNYGNSVSPGSINSIIYLGDRWVCVGNERFLGTSTDKGATWIRKMPLATAGFTNTIYQAIYDGSQVIGVGGSGEIGFSQADTVAETQWAVRKGGTGEGNTGFATNAAIRGIVYFTAHGAAHYLAVGRGMGMAYSSNGRDWRAVNTGSFLSGSDSFAGARWYNGKLFLWGSGRVFIWEP
jgi:hypothetical protein